MMKKGNMLFLSTLLAVCLTACASAVSDGDRTSSFQIQASETKAIQSQDTAVVYERVEIQHHDGKEEFDTITNVRTNNTAQKIVSCDRAMLAYDKEGNPLKLDWWSKDDELSAHFLGHHSGLTREVLPGQEDAQTGGWKLNGGLDPQVQKIAYVLFCDVEITFEDVTIWENPEFAQWCTTYEGKKIAVDVLENYYPYAQKIVF